MGDEGGVVDGDELEVAQGGIPVAGGEGAGWGGEGEVWQAIEGGGGGAVRAEDAEFAGGEVEDVAGAVCGLEGEGASVCAGGEGLGKPTEAGAFGDGAVGEGEEVFEGGGCAEVFFEV